MGLRAIQYEKNQKFGLEILLRLRADRNLSSSITNSENTLNKVEVLKDRNIYWRRTSGRVNYSLSLDSDEANSIFTGVTADRLFHRLYEISGRLDEDGATDFSKMVDEVITMITYDISTDTI